MTTNDTFQVAYRTLEREMKACAEDDAAGVFLPSVAPAGPVDYVLICMEPSLGSTSAGQVRERVQAWFRNFLSSMGDFILHFSARTYLCKEGQRYHITDFSKGAMAVKSARAARAQRYDLWYPLLLKEIKLIAKPNAGFFAVGKVVDRHLRRLGFPRPFDEVIHYSGQAARTRKEFVAKRKANFEAFKGTVSLRDIRDAAEDVLRSADVPARFHSEALARLKAPQLTDSSKQLIFNYKVAFESFRSQRDPCP
jgi:hypothetical protein